MIKNGYKVRDVDKEKFVVVTDVIVDDTNFGIENKI